MQSALIQRFIQDDRQTLGVLSAVNEFGYSFNAKTLELAWKNNQSNISCIPEGLYECRYTRSNRLSKLKGKDFYTYEILNVKDRAGIRIHSANFFYQLLGCIALGSEHKDINLDQNLDVIHSGKTIEAFEAHMGTKPFILSIKNVIHN